MRDRNYIAELVIGGDNLFAYNPHVSGGASAAPVIPWEAALPEPDAPLAAFRLLSWQHRLARVLVGRETEAAALGDWARTGPDLSLRVLTGPGGAGKTHLAAELAAALPDWHAGFVTLSQATRLPWSAHGLLAIVDDAEFGSGRVRDLLRRVAAAEAPPAPLRILLLSRVPASDWEEEIARCGAAARCDTQDIGAGALPIEAAAELFGRVVVRLAGHRIRPVPPIDATALRAWLARDPKRHAMPVATIAAAVHLLDHSETTFGLTAAEIVAALTAEERRRLDAAGAAQGIRPRGAARLLALAALRDGLDDAVLRRLTARELEAALPDFARLLDAVRKLGWWRDERVAAPEPNLMAAELLRQEVAEAGAHAAGWLWAVLGEPGAVRIPLLDRRLQDMAALHGNGGDAVLRDAMIAAVATRGQGARAWRGFLDSGARSLRLAPVGIAVGRALLQAPDLPKEERAAILVNLSVDLHEAGDAAGALAAIREAAEILRPLAAADPPRFAADYASSLNNLSSGLSNAGDAAGALAAIRETTDIFRRLAGENRARFAPDLAVSLNNLSDRLRDAGDAAGALAASREAIDALRWLAQEQDHARFAPDLARSLDVLSVRLSDVGDEAGALAAIRETIEIFRALAEKNKERFASGLALSLNNLSNRLSESGDQAGALAASREAANILRSLAMADPARFDADFALSLNNLSLDLSAAGDHVGALVAIHEAVEIRRRLAEADPARYADALERSERILSMLDSDLARRVL